MSLPNWLTTIQHLKTGLQAQLNPLRSRLLNDPYYRFQSIQEIQLAAALGIFIDVNQAGVDDWLRLPGVSIHQARSLVSLTQSGVFLYSLEDVAVASGIPLQRLKPWEPILRFCYYEPNSLCAIQPVNPNTATVEMLIRIPQVDRFLARMIVQNRQVRGAYRNLADFQQRLALPGEAIATLMHHLTF